MTSKIKNKFQLYKDIIYSDFCLIKSNTYSIYSVISLYQSKKYFCITNIVKVINDLKLLYFILTKFDTKVKRYLVLNSINTFYFNFFFKYKKNKNIKRLYENFFIWLKDYIKFDFTAYTYNIYFSLNENNITLPKIKKLFSKNIFILYSISQDKRGMLFQTYNIHNEMDDFKKVIFLIILLKKLLLKK